MKLAQDIENPISRTGKVLIGIVVVGVGYVLFKSRSIAAPPATVQLSYPIAQVNGLSSPSITQSLTLHVGETASIAFPPGWFCYGATDTYQTPAVQVTNDYGTGAAGTNPNIVTGVAPGTSLFQAYWYDPNGIAPANPPMYRVNITVVP